MGDRTDRASGYVITLEAHRKLVDALRVDLVSKAMRERRIAVRLLDELIAWFGAPDWLGPQLPLPLARRIAEFLEAGVPTEADQDPKETSDLAGVIAAKHAEIEEWERRQPPLPPRPVPDPTAGDVCACGHRRDEHSRQDGRCYERIDAEQWCPCERFVPAPSVPGEPAP